MSDSNHTAGQTYGGVTFSAWIEGDIDAPEFNGWIYGFIDIRSTDGNEVWMACPHHHSKLDWSANNSWAGWSRNYPGWSEGPSTIASNYGYHWNHWAWVKSPTALQWYCNGSLIGQELSTDANNGDANIPSAPLWTMPVSEFSIGEYGWGGTWVGRIADFQVYDYALSANEIDYLTTNGTGQIIVPINTKANLYLDGGTASDGNQIVNFEDLSVMGSQWHQQQLWP